LGKKQGLVKAAIQLFSKKGFDGTTTLEIANAAHVTEPVVYYHFKNKDGLFTHILDKTFSEYFSRLNALDDNTPTQFKKIENLIDLHFTFVDEYPDETYLITSACPAKLRDSENTCTKHIETQRQRLTSYISDCLKKGIETGEFDSMPTEATSGLIIALVNGLLRLRALKLNGIHGMRETTVEFCRRSLVK
jgi:AcrR family transcriptional regulator